MSAHERNKKSKSKTEHAKTAKDSILSPISGSAPILGSEKNVTSPSSSSSPQLKTEKINEERLLETIEEKDSKKSSKFWKLFSQKEKKSKDIHLSSQDKQTISVNSYEELPDELKKKLKPLKISPEMMDKYFYQILCILHQITKDTFIYNGKKLPSSERRNIVSEELKEKAKEIIVTMEREKDGKKKFKPIEQSGKGGFGRVFCAKEIPSKNIVAVKRLPHESEKEKNSNYAEIACLYTLKHHNVVSFNSSWIVGTEVWIVTEYMEGGTLSQALRTHIFEEDHISYICREVLKGIAFMHENKFAHRDIKSNNIMLSVAGNVKIIDFGLCADVSDGDRLQTVGTVFWMSPEMITRKHHGVKTDIWSFGIVTLEMYLRAPPYNSSRLLVMWKTVSDQILNSLDEGKISICDEARSFVKEALDINVKKRSSASELLEHPFVNRKGVERNLDSVLKQIFVSNTLAKSGI